MRRRVVEGPANDSWEVEAADGLALLCNSGWISLLGNGGRIFKARGGEDGTEPKGRSFCRWSDMLWLLVRLQLPSVNGKGRMAKSGLQRSRFINK